MSTEHQRDSSSDHQAKIAKLLAKAEGTDNPVEAETFTEAAERLMIKWGIEEALVRAAMTGDDQPPEKIVEQRVTYTDTYSDAFVAFGAAIVDGLGQMQTMQRRSHRHPDIRYLYIIGFESDVQRAVMLLASLRLQAITAMKAWWRTSDERHQLKGWRAFKARRQFIMSFGYAVEDRLAVTRHETVADMGGASTELVLRDRGAQVDDWFAEQYPKLRNTRGLHHALAGHFAGAAAGRQADLGEDHLPSTRDAIDHATDDATDDATEEAEGGQA